MSQKGFAPIFILVGILIIAIASGAYYLGRQTTPKSQQPVAILQTPQPSPTPDETTNWKTYSNKMVGYSFSYPEYLKLIEVGYKRGESVILTGKSGEQIQIDAATEATISLEQWIKDLDSTGGAEILSTNNTLISNLSAVQRYERKKGAGGEKYEEENVYLVAKNRLINISSTRAEDTLKALETILSTLKFTQ